MRFFSSAVYSELPKEDHENLEYNSLEHRSSPLGKLGSIAPHIASFVSGILLMLFVWKAASWSNHNHSLQIDTITHTFHYNRSFSYPPSNHTNNAWRDLFPTEGGFFTHPTVAPTRSTFSVFHQLHCLNAIRGGYWASHHFALRGDPLVDDDLPDEIQESHIRHCIDLIRQSLMCSADMTLEVADPTINGVRAFRTPHQCKDWEQLRTWASEQQAKQHVKQVVQIPKINV